MVSVPTCESTFMYIPIGSQRHADVIRIVLDSAVETFEATEVDFGDGNGLQSAGMGLQRFAQPTLWMKGR